MTASYSFMTKRFFWIFVFLFFALNSFGQKTKFAQLVEQMHFNVFDRKPNKQIQPFIKKYFPNFLTWKNENAGWAYTLKAKDLPVDTTMHSFNFTNHPLVKAKFNSGRFDFITYEKKNELPLIASWSLFFSFDNYSDATNCFDNIYKMFDTLSKDKITFTQNNRRIAQLTNESKLSDVNCVELVLVSDELFDNRYKLYFEYGRHYKEN